MELTERQIDFANLVELNQATEARKQTLVMDFVHRRIGMQRYNEIYAELEAELDRVHFEYIAKYQVFDRAPEVIRLPEIELLQYNKN